VGKKSIHISSILFKSVLSVVAILACLSQSTSWAEDARVLPKGRSRFSFIFAETATISQTYDDQGEAESVANPYNISLDSSALKSFDSQLGSVVQLLNNSGYYYNGAAPANHRFNINGQGVPLGDALSVGNLGVSAASQREQYNFSYQYGVTDRLSIGFNVPIIHSMVTVNKSITGDNTAQDIYNELQGHNDIPGLSQALDYLASSNVGTLQSLLVSKGYAPFQNSDQTGLGDIVLGGRYNYYKTRDEGFISSFQAGSTIPTGSLHDSNQLTQVDLGQGAWDLGVANIENYTVYKNIMLSHSVHYTHPFVFSRDMRVRTDSTDFIPGAADQDRVNVQLGDKYWTDLGLTLSLPYSTSLTGGYEWSWKEQDKYSGSSAKDYTYLSQGTRTYLETLTFGASINSIKPFLDHDFPIPCQFGINYFLPTAGKNTVIAPYGTAELALFF